MKETEDKSPSMGGNDTTIDKDISESSIPLSQGLERYFEERGMTDSIRHILAMDMQRYLYGKGLDILHNLILDIEGKLQNIPEAIHDRDDSTLEELIDTIAEGFGISECALRHILISMALR